MTLEQFVARLHGAGCDLRVEDLLDAFWLATRGRHLSLRGPGPADWQPDAATDAESGSDLRDQGPAVAPRPDKRREEVPIYGAGRVADDQRTVAASAVALPAGQPLPGRMELARALRPLRARGPSRTQLEVDELATVEASAEHRGALYPVFRPVPEPWFDAHVVLEDDPAITLWRDTMQSFSRMLEDIGAFRSVASWRLRGAARQAPSGGDRDGAWLEGPAGLRAGPRLLAGGGVRRLIFFVTHGGSAGWLDGRYARVLAPWARTSSVLILHLFDRHRWLRGTLGDVHGTCAAPVPGAITADFDVATFWWRAPPDAAGLVPIPAVPLTPAGLGDWALTLMARGRRSPVFLLDPVPPPVADAPLNAAPLDYERAVGLLRESSPAAFRLAVALARSAFTIPVARVVQESRLAAGAGQSDLAEVLLSGLVFARSPPTDSDQADCWFDFDDAARAVLLRSLRKADAEAIANDLEERVSRYLERIGGRAISFRALVPDARGKYQLPDWAQPFARFGIVMLGSRGETNTVRRRIGELAAAIAPETLAELARYAASIPPGAALEPAAPNPLCWGVLREAGLITQDTAGRWWFLPEAQPRLAEFAAGSVPTRSTPFGEPFPDETPWPEIVGLPDGTFVMGSPEAVDSDDARPTHAVKFGADVFGELPVTIGEFNDLRPTGPDSFGTDAEGEASGATSDAFPEEMRPRHVPNSAISNIPLSGGHMKRSTQDRVVRLDKVRRSRLDFYRQKLAEIKTGGSARNVDFQAATMIMSLYEAENLDGISARIRSFLLNTAFLSTVHRMGFLDMAYISLVAMEFEREFEETSSAQDRRAMQDCLVILARYFRYHGPDSESSG